MPTPPMKRATMKSAMSGASAEAMAETLDRVRAFGGEIRSHICDVTDGAAVAAMVEDCLAAYGRIDVLVNNVGGSAAGGPVELSEAAFDAQLERQRRLARWLSVLSPTMVAQEVLLDAAGTSVNQFEHFRHAAAQFQREWKRYFEPRVLDAATLTPAEIAAAPVFAYQREPASAMLRRTAPTIVAMLIAGALLWWAGFRAYRGYVL